MLVDMKMLQIHRRDGTNYCFLLDVEDYDRLGHLSWHVVVPDPCFPHYYAQRHTRGGKVQKEYLHREILGCPEGYIDHINGNTLDNRKKNLRITNAKVNSCNVHQSALVPNFVFPEGHTMWGFNPSGLDRGKLSRKGL